MAKVTDSALILPISDVDLSRDENRKLRLAGYVTAVSPSNASFIVLTDPYPSAASTTAGLILVDLSLCTDQSGNGGESGGWNKKHPQQVPPELKSAIMVIGHLTRHTRPVDIGFLANPEKADWGQVQVRSAVSMGGESLPNRFFVLEAMLVKPLDYTFDLKLWNHAARGKRKAILID
ncbi:hypothetical protein [Sporisorium scitamineum]|uniref:Uncharacterized protein n=1 Tax=Sporisorium scitamineum TaxID=49012 RepID=A0A0F7RVA8_9BASI|nr:hypothetical protein [Sporisorium scitamineum]